MSEPKTILFVCTGNVFRSLTADLALKRELAGESDYQVASAGTRAKDKPLRQDVIDSLAKNGLDPSGHRPRLLTAEILNSAALVIVMGEENRQFLKDKFGYEAVFFNQVSHGLNTPVPDLDEVVPDFLFNKEAARQCVGQTIDYIVASAPSLARNLPRLLQPQMSLAPETTVPVRQDPGLSP